MVASCGYSDRPSATPFASASLTSNQSEREPRRIATGSKAWLFCGSDDHAQAAGNLLTLVASARFHGLEPEQYLRDRFRALPQWPRDRSIELAPKYWTATALVDQDPAAVARAGVGELIVRLLSRIHGAITLRVPKERGRRSGDEPPAGLCSSWADAPPPPGEPDDP